MIAEFTLPGGTVVRLPVDDDAGRPSARLPEVDAIAAAAIKVYGIDAADFWSFRRYEPVATARHVTCYLARRYTAYSLPEIGRAVGRDHSTVLYSVNRIARQIDHDSTLAAKVADVRRELSR